ncbi:hypothetical protein AAFF_G00436670, partial [Aldrovandia affinis]
MHQTLPATEQTTRRTCQWDQDPRNTCRLERCCPNPLHLELLLDCTRFFRHSDFSQFFSQFSNQLHPLFILIYPPNTSLPLVNTRQANSTRAANSASFEMEIGHPRPYVLHGGPEP